LPTSSRNGRNPRRVFEQISPNWIHDLHIHSNWSQDNLNGPSLSDYVPLAEKYKIHIGFAEHFELAYYEIPNSKWGKWKLNLATVDQYLEELDQIYSLFPHITVGLELDFYPQRIQQLQNFMDRYRNEFDFFIGSLHELEDFRAITVPQDLNWLIQSYGGFDNVLKKYWNYLQSMISAEIFDGIAHPDVIYRFFSETDRKIHPEYDFDQSILKIGELCVYTNTLMEVNLSGLRSPWKRTFPSESYVNHLRANDVDFFVGSDSHTTTAFEQSVLDIRKMNQLIQKRV
jgi:HisJ family histidinol phosphate phosphatase